MRELLDTLDGWIAEGAVVGRAVVVRTFGSAPRGEGAVLLATADGRIAGSISGGCVEGAAVEAITAARQDGRERVIRYGISNEAAWDVGLACGGTIDVLVSPGVPAAAIAAARDVAWDDGRGRAVATVLPADAPSPALVAHHPGSGPGSGPGFGAVPGEPLVVHEDGRLEGTLGDPVADAALAASAVDLIAHGVSRTVEVAGRQVFVEVYSARPRLVIVGAVEVARTLVRLARELGYETVVIDGRAAFATAARFPEADRLIVGWLDEAADAIALRPADAVAILTHDAKFDEPAIIVALARGCRYVGAIGSRATQRERNARLAAAGVASGALARLRGPVGLDLGGRLPAETALAILAEVVAERRGGSGRPLREVAREPVSEQNS